MTDANRTGRLRRREVLAALGALGLGAWLPGCTQGGRSPFASDAGAGTPWRLGGEGIVVHRADADYESWRTAMPWQRWVAARAPDLIARPADRSQIMAALAHARSRGLKVAVKSGGHNVSEAFLRDGGMLLDLDRLSALEVDTAGASAWAEPALWSRDLMLGLAEAGLAFPVAHCATVSMGGYLLGGGIGINTDEWGIVCHSIQAAEVVLADGRSVIASEHEHPDLLWAVRGAGTGFFGVVTRYRLRCRPLPGAIRESIYGFPLARAPEVARWFEDIAARGMPRTELMLLLAHNPQAPSGAAPMDSKVCIARIVQFCDTEAECVDALRPVRESALAASAGVRMELQPTTIDRMMIGSVNAAAGLGFGRYRVNTIWTGATSEAVSALIEPFSHAPSHKSHFVISLRHDTRLTDDACFSRIDRGFVGCYGLWDTQSEDAANIAWTDGIGDRMMAHASGGYINEMDTFRRPERLQQAFSAAAMERLRALRSRYDPQGLFQDFPGIS